MYNNFNFVETYSLSQFGKLTGAKTLIPHKLDTGTIFMVFGPGKNDVTYINLVSGNNEEEVISNVEHEVRAISEFTSLHIVALVAAAGLYSDSTVHRKTTHTSAELTKHTIKAIHHIHFTFLLVIFYYINIIY